MFKLKDVIFWLKNKMFRRSAIALYNEAMDNQSLSLEELRKKNWKKRVDLVNYAYNNIPFYKEYWDKHNFNPALLQHENDWNKIPPLEKLHIRNSAAQLLNSKLPKSRISVTTTGGSTGKPLKIYRDNNFKLEILGWRAFTWWKVSPADNTAITHRRVPKGWIAILKNRLLWWPTKRVYLSAASMSDDDIAKFVSDTIRKKIVWLTGYAGALESIADFILRSHIHIKSLRLVWSTSAPLSTNARMKMEQAFGCKIMNQYGSCEVSNIAQQCPYSEHMHINYDFVHIDIVDKDGNALKDTEGDILVTDLANYVFPLIRYRIGDRGCLVSEPCSCGVSLPLMKNVKGRISDTVYTPSGVIVDGNYLTTIFDNYIEVIDQFQVYQKSDYSITIYYKPKAVSSEHINEVLEKILETLKKDVRNEVAITLQQVDKIAHDAGKTRYIISEIALSKYSRQ